VFNGTEWNGMRVARNLKNNKKVLVTHNTFLLP